MHRLTHAYERVEKSTHLKFKIEIKTFATHWLQKKF